MPKNIRPIRIEGNIAFVSLTKGYTAIIDASDAPLVDQWNWTAQENNRTVYAFRNDRSDQKQRTVRLHRAILGAPDGLEVDHISGDGLDCRRHNLRIVTGAENSRNRRVYVNNKSGVKGVSWQRDVGKWKAEIRLGGKRHYLGLFSDIPEAAAAYAKASAALHGDFGRIS